MCPDSCATRGCHRNIEDIMSWLRRKERKDVLGGALMALLGLFTALEGSSYHIGILARMGPGYFPVALGIILAALGLLIILNADDAGAPSEDEAQASNAPQGRGWACIIAGLLAFIVLGKWGGLMPATFALVFISAMG